MNYAFTYANGALTVNPATLTYTANAAGMTYGGTVPTLSGAVTGFVAGETQAAVTTGTAASFATQAGATSNAGSYAINGSGLTANNGNYTFAQAAGNTTALTINKAALTVTANNVAKTYNGASYSGGNGVSYSGFVNGQSSTVLGSALVYSGSSQTAKNTGSYVITPSGLTSVNYAFTYANGALTVNPAMLLANGSRIYDGTTAFGGGKLTVSGVNGESFTATGNGTLASRNVQTSQALASPGTLALAGTGGALTSNYNALSAGNTSVSVTPASISAVTGITAANKVYDATTSATLNSASAGFTGMISGDTLNVATASSAFANKNVGTNEPVTISGIGLGGTDAGNYTLGTSTASTTATITKAPLPVTGLIASNKVYDTKLTDPLTGTASITALGADTVTVGGTAAGSFANKNAGTNRAVTVTGNTITGTDAGNYTLAQQTGLKANISPRPITVTADNQTSIAGMPDPVLTYTLEPRTTGRGLLPDDVFSGTLQRQPGTRPGNYAIRHGTVSDARNPNYLINFVAGTLRIKAANNFVLDRAIKYVENVIVYDQGGITRPNIAVGDMTEQIAYSRDANPVSNDVSGKDEGSNTVTDHELDTPVLKSSGGPSTPHTGRVMIIHGNINLPGHARGLVQDNSPRHRWELK